MTQILSRKARHFFHVVSNVRPIVWIGLYIILIPIYALIYLALPDGQFRIPDGGATDYGSWLYYSIVTISTLGFGDYTPAHGWAQLVTALEVMCGVTILGFFLNAVGSMKSEIDVESELEKQRLVREATEKEKLVKSTPALIHLLNMFLSYCYAVTTPVAKRKEHMSMNPDFSFNDMADMYHSANLPFDHSPRPAVERLMKSSAHTSLALDALQARIDMTQWPELLENCFKFVANFQMFSASSDFESSAVNLLPEALRQDSSDAGSKISELIAGYDTTQPKEKSPMMAPFFELYYFVKENSRLAREIEVQLTTISSQKSDA